MTAPTSGHMQVSILFSLICNFSWEFAQLTTGSKDVKGVIDKRKRKKSGVIEIPWAVYAFVQRARAFREKLKNNKDDRDSKVNNLVSTNPAIARNECPTPPKSGPESHDHVERRGGCNSPPLDPNKELPDTQGIPLNEEEMKIWLKFKELDKKTMYKLDKWIPPLAVRKKSHGFIKGFSQEVGLIPRTIFLPGFSVGAREPLVWVTTFIPLVDGMVLNFVMPVGAS
uniref:Uncharacterized protein n=1 Tax=Tanacetum cinerariifolium TaxID=118510 RepID=A0A6L2P9L9_TANCI|nr:hypothetical protein [Tanacetum cinerariifolium]